MSKTIGLKQLAQKQYTLVDLDEQFKNFIGEIEDAFDAIAHGMSGNGKSNLIAQLLIELIKKLNCKAEYVAYEEGHAKTMQNLLIIRYKMLELLGNVLQVTDHYTYEQLKARMARRKSAKIFVIDSIQAAKFTAEQCAELKRLFVFSRKKKIIIYVSWAEGKTPQGAVAKQ
jgi:predicted ATP-dependent serine protease